MTVKGKGSKQFESVDLLVVCCIVLLIIVTLAGICSFSTEKGYYVTNQYGDNIKIIGNGIYKYDSFFNNVLDPELKEKNYNNKTKTNSFDGNCALLCN
ncbi:hypothetical protein D3C73_796940 [compost metagenome]